jgi:4-hydroxythreonine-4-phosphate dehydrogenase
VVWVGTGGLAAVLPSVLGLTSNATPAVTSPAAPVLIVVGSFAASSLEQVARLVDAGCRHVPPARVGDVLRDGANAVVTVDAPAGHEDSELVELLADELAPFASLVGGLVATGGDTASAVLRAFGVDALELVDEVEPGIPLSVASGAWRGPVVTKAGAFGDADSLVRAVKTLEGDR